jgi:hypothetical protein
VKRNVNDRIFRDDSSSNLPRDYRLLTKSQRILVIALGGTLCSLVELLRAYNREILPSGTLYESITQIAIFHFTLFPALDFLQVGSSHESDSETCLYCSMTKANKCLYLLSFCIRLFLVPQGPSPRIWTVPPSRCGVLMSRSKSDAHTRLAIFKMTSWYCPASCAGQLVAAWLSSARSGLSRSMRLRFCAQCTTES